VTRRSTAGGTAHGWAPDLPTAAQWHEWRLDPSWSRVLDVPSHAGSTHRWHVLDTGGDDPVATVVCVHGNPTWGYAWATFLRRFGSTHRVIAIDQLGMGFSERTDMRRYATRVLDLADVIDALHVDRDRPLFVAAHDWGGAIALGWAVDHVDELDGMILCNTGIAVPAGRSAPAIIRLAASAPVLELVCHGTPTFVEGTVRLSGRRLTAEDRHAFRAPYRTAPARVAIADFVGDIPLKPGHPSEASLAAVAARLGELDVPVLLAWGSKDPVFNDDFAADLQERLPNTVLHRFPMSNHLVMAETGGGESGVAAVTERFIASVLEIDHPRLRQENGAPAPENIVTNEDFRGLWAAVGERRGERTVAFVDMATGDTLRYDELADRIDSIAAELCHRGLEPGDRVAMLTPPGVDLVAAVYGVWRAGGVTVIADRGLGLKGLGNAVRGARPDWLIGPRRALVAAKSLRWAPRSIHIDIDDLVTAGSGPVPAAPAPDDLAAILFTSGATGPAKGVRYRHRQLAEQRDALARTYDITGADRLVAAFAPFALYGPALGIPTCLPDCDVTKPGELTAAALDAACMRIDATLAFGSPAALANVLATVEPGAPLNGLRRLRILFSAGAPVPSETLHAIADLAPTTSLHTPYGMTEALPVADIDLDGIDAALRDDPTGGVCVGPPVQGAVVRIVDPHGGVDPLGPGVTGEILVAAPWVSDGYLGLWGTEQAARPNGVGGWHRSGDVGHLDEQGRLWVEGRLVHMLDTVDGAVTPVPIERAVERGLPIARCAAVGVGPAGLQQLAVVLEDPAAPTGLASSARSAAVRDLVAAPVAAVLNVAALPVDIRHNAKIDRTALSAWADDVLAGRRARPPK
jgi:acyl-coenzyme A synthetase/AMP-(fatty) acid ligase/pimeloyl-ACP methyl ester carboxylesterase